ncbi:abortive infection protein [Nocardia wallacei]|uniref:Abortive infection protein n=1 Tax=Nocardia wallacei TaxID=480035 RepID=A0A7G1L175_9NOCA|nr:abortive infection protein [Nocardia wallacei]BCK59114.1 hypothetical protein NWFMUON74_68860 [Nocardia wallacei]
MSLEYRGVNYDTGTDYSAGAPTRVGWDMAQVSSDMADIARKLHANSVCVYGSRADRLREAAGAAAAAGLTVWVQPRSIESDASRTLILLEDVATDAEHLRVRGAEVHLNIGCELSIFSTAVIPGRSYAQRALRLTRRWPLLPLYNWRLNRLLSEMADVARARFRGSLTYGCGLWEDVDWRLFDIVGQNFYRLKHNERDYSRRLRDFHRHGKPVIITEFGCGAFRGADDLGPTSHEVIDYSTDPAQLTDAPTRDEATQAKYLEELLREYRRAKVAGAFVFEYVAEGNPHSLDPGLDLDMAGYGIVLPHDRTPKQAFHTVARIYNAESEILRPPDASV